MIFLHILLLVVGFTVLVKETEWFVEGVLFLGNVAKKNLLTRH